MSVVLAGFDKLDIRICRVLKSEKIQGRQKLLKLVVDIGSSEVQIVAGGGEFYPPDYFIGKNLVILANLQPRVIAGIESNGMLLAADDKGKPIWLTVSEDVRPGTRIR
jgi:tRNA-binding protein